MLEKQLKHDSQVLYDVFADYEAFREFMLEDIRIDTDDTEDDTDILKTDTDSDTYAEIEHEKRIAEEKWREKWIEEKAIPMNSIGYRHVAEVIRDDIILNSQGKKTYSQAELEIILQRPVNLFLLKCLKYAIEHLNPRNKIFKAEIIEDKMMLIVGYRCFF